MHIIIQIPNLYTMSVPQATGIQCVYYLTILQYHKKQQMQPPEPNAATALKQPAFHVLSI